MYKPSSYYIATVITSMLSFLWYPLIVSLVGFWMFDIDNNGIGGFAYWTLTLLLTATCGFSFGMMLGTIFSNQNTAISANLLFAMIFSFGGGMYANTGEEANPLIKAISYVSPIRYGSELLFQLIIKEKPGKELILDYFGYTWGTTTCFMALLGFTICSLLAGWGILTFKYRNV
jgi:ABC-type transport system involved in multi-copper enzyme maturation permease subunit